MTTKLAFLGVLRCVAKHSRELHKKILHYTTLQDPGPMFHVLQYYGVFPE